MKRKMLLITAFLAVALLITAGVFIATKSAVMEAAAISVGVTLYHFVMRLLVGAVVNLIMKNEADHNNIWFREKRLENKLYRLIGVRRWKKYIPSYSPDMFDINKTKEWLYKMLKSEKTDLNDVFYAFYKNNKCFIIKKNN